MKIIVIRSPTSETSSLFLLKSNLTDQSFLHSCLLMFCHLTDQLIASAPRCRNVHFARSLYFVSDLFSTQTIHECEDEQQCPTVTLVMQEGAFTYAYSSAYGDQSVLIQGNGRIRLCNVQKDFQRAWKWKSAFTSMTGLRRIDYYTWGSIYLSRAWTDKIVLQAVITVPQKQPEHSSTRRFAAAERRASV